LPVTHSACNVRKRPPRLGVRVETRGPKCFPPRPRCLTSVVGHSSRSDFRSIPRTCSDSAGMSRRYQKRKWPDEFLICSSSVRRNNGRGEISIAVCTRPEPRQPFASYAIKSVAPGLGHLGRQTFPRPDHLCGKFAVEFTNFLRPSDKVRKSLPCEFGLNLNGVVERPHTHELLHKGPALQQRLPGVVHVGIRNGLNADWTIVRRCGCLGWEGVRGCGRVDGGDIFRCGCVD